ncbi:hypothetical protein QBC34DRAFT_490854 [Podospora aff. communis PSN243]|uniref:Uncharacterized protein n=1 Tax=Podospora aff. communis PSN243 TaxID=3040156 RepID=A0AAV9H3E9_9PEZI|nr:hypothetical protein QBC34DRAFT_490854 [Podospora aff. communis PSN243]
MKLTTLLYLALGTVSLAAPLTKRDPEPPPIKPRDPPTRTRARAHFPTHASQTREPEPDPQVKPRPHKRDPAPEPQVKPRPHKREPEPEALWTASGIRKEENRAMKHVLKSETGAVQWYQCPGEVD